MNILKSIAIFGFFTIAQLCIAARTSPSYSVPVETYNAGGGVTSSSTADFKTSIGGFSGVFHSTSYTITSGFDLDPSDNDDPDDDNDGFTNSEELAAGSDPNNPNSTPEMTSLSLNEGYNQVSFPGETLAYGNLKTLMEQALGGNSVVETVLIPDAENQAYFAAGFDESGNFFGDNPSLPPGQGLPGLIVVASQDQVFQYTSKICHTWDLKVGVNLLGSACIPVGLTSFTLLHNIGNTAGSDPSSVISAIQAFRPETGRFDSTSYGPDALPLGSDFPINPDNAYLIYMKQDVLDFEP